MKKILKNKILLICLAIAACLAAIVLLFLGIMNSRTFQFFGGIVDHAETQDKIVALTFDDGPTLQTDKILAFLDARSVKATFFLIGNEIEKHPGDVEKLVRDGQQIGNHTYSHKRMIFVSYPYVKEEIEKTDSLIRNAGYTGEIQFRPPNGKKLFSLPLYLSQTGRKTILWDVEPNSLPEANISAQSIAAYTIQNVKPGSIILLHPMNDEKSIDAIPLIIDGLLEKGYTFRLINDLPGVGKH